MFLALVESLPEGEGKHEKEVSSPQSSKEDKATTLLDDLFRKTKATYYTLLCVLSTLIQVYMYVRVLYTAVCVVHAHTGIHVRTCIIQCCVCCPHSYRYTCTYVYYINLSLSLSLSLHSHMLTRTCTHIT